MKKINFKKLTKPRKTKVKAEKDKNTNVKRNIKVTILSAILIGGIVAITGILLFALYIILTAPNFNKDLLYQKEASIIYDINGNELIRTGENNVELVSYEELPQVLIDAIVATEDSRFFQHTGLDVPRFVVASFNQIIGNSDAGGASTLSMQVIKNTYTDNVASGIEGVVRKFTDVYMSIFKLENAYTKEEIIEFYVNSQWLGYDGNANYTGITGVEQGSQYFFGKSVSDLTLAEATILAGMFQAPVSHNPYTNPESTRERQTTVLNLMIRHGYITEEEKEAVLDIPIESLLVSKESSSSNDYQVIIDYVIQEVEDKTGKNPYSTPMEVYTTIDPDIQDILVAVENGESYSIPEDRGDLQFGMAITDVKTGAIVGMSSGIDYANKGHNRADARRQPGSTAKPIFDYAPHIEYLNSFPGYLFLDEASSYSNGSPIRNWDNQYWGLMTMKDALVSSRNIPALTAFQEVAEVDLELIEDFVQGLGIDYGEALYESASIGGFDGVSPIESSAAYATFARGGYYIEPYTVTKIVYLEDDQTEEFKYTKEKAMSEQTAFLINDMLTGSGVAGFSISGTDLAAKTGTTTIDADQAEKLGIPTYAIMDNWVVSYSPEYSFSTWIGYDQLSSEYYMTSANIGTIRNGLSKAVGSELFSTGKQFDMPSGISSVTIEKDTIPAALASSNTPDNMKETYYFKSGSEPTEVSTRYETLDNVTNLKAVSTGTDVKLTWDEIKTPEWIDTTFLTDYFNEYYGNHASKYYEQRINYNLSTIGNVIYEIYLDTNGTLTLLGTSADGEYTTKVTESGNQKYVVKANYSIFTTAVSSGSNVTINVSVDSNVNDSVNGGNNNDTDSENPDDNNTDNNNNNNNNTDTNTDTTP